MNASNGESSLSGAGVSIENAKSMETVTVIRCGMLNLWSVGQESIFHSDGNCPTHIVTVNAEIFAIAHQDPRLRAIMESSINTIDGRILQGICKLMYPKVRVIRQKGARFVYDLAAYCQKNSRTLFLLGATATANCDAIRRLNERFPRLSVKGYSPPFTDCVSSGVWNDSIFEELKRARPSHLVVCFGPRKQEYWIDQNRPRLRELQVECVYGLGGTIDFVSGAKPSAPKIVEQLGLEWLFRLMTEPVARFSRTIKMFAMFKHAIRTRRRVEVLPSVER